MQLHGAVATIERLQVANLTIKLILILERAARELQAGDYMGCRSPCGFMAGLSLGGLFQPN